MDLIIQYNVSFYKANLNLYGLVAALSCPFTTGFEKVAFLP